MTKFITKVRNEIVGATAIEYGLIAAAVAIVILTGAQFLGTNLLGVFNNVANAV